MAAAPCSRPHVTGESYEAAHFPKGPLPLGMIPPLGLEASRDKKPCEICSANLVDTVNGEYAVQYFKQIRPITIVIIVILSTLAIDALDPQTREPYAHLLYHTSSYRKEYRI